MTKYVNPTLQAMNLIRYVGDKINETGEVISRLPENISDIMGARSKNLAREVIMELKEKGLIRIGYNVNLSLDGWKQYEAEQHGEVASHHGFLAMPFGFDELDALVENVLKPAVKNETGYDLYNLKDIPKAGIIDNILRIAIRDARFVIVDLTHDNRGAYWEAGYAEGLGKPVIYICEKEKFDEVGTHFDTNHLTTIIWTTDKEENFRKELIATLRRSLDL